VICNTPKRLDVTLRDGGFTNSFRLGRDDVTTVVRALARSAADMVELGYVGGLPTDHGHFPNAGPTYDLPLLLISDLVREADLPCAVMMHPQHPKTVDFLALAETGISLVRVPFRPSSNPAALRVLEQLAAAKLRSSANLILGSWWTNADLEYVARTAEQLGATMIYVADTTSSFVPADVTAVFTLLRRVVSVPLGFHAHDGCGLALANTLAAFEHGATWLDASTFGIGRDAGNTPMEVLVALADSDPTSLERQLVASLPVLRVFERMDSEAVWLRLCALLDLSPPCARLLEEVGRTHRLHRIEAATLLARSNGTRPLTSDMCHGLFTKHTSPPNSPEQL